MTELHFLRPYWFLALLPVLILLWTFWQRKFHSRSWQAVCDPRLLAYLLSPDSAGQKKPWPVMLLALMALLTITALAGPAWKKLQQPVFREQSALVIVLDLSRSMDVADIKPSRLALARLKVIDLLKQRKEGQTALIVYAANAYTVSPLTDDTNTIVSLVKTLNTNLMPVQGSRADKALKLATDLLKQAAAVRGHILLVTDGVQRSTISKLAKRVTSKGHKLSVLGIGTKQGAPIELAEGGFLKTASGVIVIPKLDLATLRKLSGAGHGRYHSLVSDDSDLEYLLAGIDSLSMEAQRKETSFTADSWQEEGTWLLLIILPFAAMAFRRGYLTVLLVILLPLVPQPASAFEWDELWVRPDQKAAKAMQQGEADNTAISPELFSDPQWKASAQYRAGQYKQSAETLRDVTTPDALYNKGNALAKIGKLPEAIQAYEQALEKEPDHADAKYNRQQVQKKLQQQSSGDGQDGDDKQKPDDKDKQQESADKQDKQNSQSKDQQGDKNKQAGQDDQDVDPDQKDPKTSEQDKDTDKKEQDAEEKQSAKQQESQEKQDEKKQQAADMKQDMQQKEMLQAVEQWLRRIPDDPGGLLRRKFQYEHQRQQRNNASRGSSEQQPW